MTTRIRVMVDGEGTWLHLGDLKQVFNNDEIVLQAAHVMKVGLDMDEPRLEVIRRGLAFVIAYATGEVG